MTTSIAIEFELLFEKLVTHVTTKNDAFLETYKRGKKFIAAQKAEEASLDHASKDEKKAQFKEAIAALETKISENCKSLFQDYDGGDIKKITLYAREYVQLKTQYRDSHSKLSDPVKNLIVKAIKKQLVSAKATLKTAIAAVMDDTEKNNKALDLFNLLREFFGASLDNKEDIKSIFRMIALKAGKQNRVANIKDLIATFLVEFDVITNDESEAISALPNPSRKRKKDDATDAPAVHDEEEEEEDEDAEQSN
jgi:hypothetical protein